MDGPAKTLGLKGWTGIARTKAGAATDLVCILFGKVEEQRLALKTKGGNLACLGAANAGNALTDETE